MKVVGKVKSQVGFSVPPPPLHLFTGLIGMCVFCICIQILYVTKNSDDTQTRHSYMSLVV